MRFIVFLVLTLTLAFPAAAQDARPVITPENADELAQAEIIGSGILLDAAFVESGTAIAAVTTRRVYIYSPDALDTPERAINLGDYPGSDRLARATFVGAPVVFGENTVVIEFPETRLLVDLVGNRVWRDTTGGVGAQALNTDGTLRATAPSRDTRQARVDLLDSTGEARSLFDLGEGAITALAFAPDGRLVVAGARIGVEPARFLSLWDVKSGEMQVELSFEGRELVETLDVSQAFVGLQRGDNYEVYTLDTLELAHTLPNAEGARINSDATIAAYVQDGALVMVDLPTGEERLRVDQVSCALRPRVFFSPNGATVYVADVSTSEGVISAWDVDTGELAGVADGSGFGFAPQGLDMLDANTIVTGSSNTRPNCGNRTFGHGLRTYSIRLSAQNEFTPIALPGVGPVDAISDGTVAFGAFRQAGIVRSEGVYLTPPSEALGLANNVALSDDGAWLAATSTNSVFLWRTAALDDEPVVLPATASWFGRSLAFTDTHLIYTSGSNLEWFNLERMEGDHTLGFDDVVRGLALHEPTQTIAVYLYDRARTGEAGYSPRVMVYSYAPENAPPLREFPVMEERFWMAFNPEGTLLAMAVPGGGDFSGPGTVIYDVAGGEEVGQAGVESPITFTPDGTRLVGRYGVNIAVWSVNGQ